MEHFVRWGPDMSGTFIQMRSRYEWNIEHKGVQVVVERGMSGTL